MNPNGPCTKDKERRDLEKCWYMFDHKLSKCVFPRYTCDVKVLWHFSIFSLQQVCTIWILFTYALLSTHVYCIMYVHSPSKTREIHFFLFVYKCWSAVIRINTKVKSLRMKSVSQDVLHTNDDIYDIELEHSIHTCSLDISRYS